MREREGGKKFARRMQGKEIYGWEGAIQRGIVSFLNGSQGISSNNKDMIYFREVNTGLETCEVNRLWRIARHERIDINRG